MLSAVEFLDVYGLAVEGLVAVDCLITGCLTVDCLTVGCFAVDCLTVGCLAVDCRTVGCLTVDCLAVEVCLIVGCLAVDKLLLFVGVLPTLDSLLLLLLLTFDFLPFNVPAFLVTGGAAELALFEGNPLTEDEDLGVVERLERFCDAEDKSKVLLLLFLLLYVSFAVWLFVGFAVWLFVVVFLTGRLAVETLLVLLVPLPCVSHLQGSCLSK